MSTLRKKRIDEVFQILRDNKGQVKFGVLFGLMSEKHGTTKETVWSYLEALETSGKIEPLVGYMTHMENEVLIKLLENAEKQQKKK